MDQKKPIYFPALKRASGLLAVSLVAGVLLMLNMQRHHEPTMHSRHGWPLVYLDRQSSILPLNTKAVQEVNAWPLPAQESESRTFSLMNGITDLICALSICAASYALASGVTGLAIKAPNKQSAGNTNDGVSDSSQKKEAQQKKKTSGTKKRKPPGDHPQQGQLLKCLVQQELEFEPSWLS